jgi:hypothetical protein
LGRGEEGGGGGGGKAGGRELGLPAISSWLFRPRPNLRIWGGGVLCRTEEGWERGGGAFRM